MTIGRMRQRVQIQSAVETVDTFGERDLRWTPITNGDIWAAVEPMGGGERNGPGQTIADATHRVTVRWRDEFNVTSKMRVVYGSRNLNVLYKENIDERDRMLVMQCKESV